MTFLQPVKNQYDKILHDKLCLVIGKTLLIKTGINMDDEFHSSADVMCLIFNFHFHAYISLLIPILYGSKLQLVRLNE